MVGGTTVVHKGLTLTGATSVTFNGVPATSFTVNSYVQITAVAPAHATGWVNIAVHNAKGTSSNTLASWYQYT